MSKHILLLLLAVQIYKVTNLPSLKRSKEITTVSTIHTPVANSIPSTRKEKSANIPLSYRIHQHQILVPNLHVIPINNVQQYHEISHNNITHSVFPFLFPIHNLVPVHDLTVIPLHRVSEQKVSYRVHDEDDGYRNPLGGYGVGWQFGGHGAGHGFHYSYG